MRCALALGTVLFLLPGSEAQAQTHAQFTRRWLDVGSLAHVYSQAGGKGLGATGILWPYLWLGTGFLEGLDDGDETFLGVKNWTDPSGKRWEHMVAFLGDGKAHEPMFYPVTFKTVGQFEKPEVLVDGLPTRRVPVTVDEVDPSMKADRKIVQHLRTTIGVDYYREILQFSNEYHDNYHIIDVTLTNTGNTDGDAEVELPNQTIEDLIFWWDRRWASSRTAHQVIGNGAAWGKQHMHDAVRDGDMRAIVSWQGYNPTFTKWDPLGAPAIEGGGRWFPVEVDTIGRLTAHQFMGFSLAHAPASAASPADDPNQPATMAWNDANEFQYTGTDPNDPNNLATWYERMTRGLQFPFHAEVVAPDRDFAHNKNSPTMNAAAGMRVAMGVGPYTLRPGESIRLVMVEGASGLSLDATIDIGRAYKNLWRRGADYDDIPYDADKDGVIEDDERMNKNEWVMTGHDSLLQTLARAQANLRSGYNIPKAPRPPRRFEVNSGVDAITLKWELYPGENPTGFEVYRTRNQYQGDINNDYEYELIATLGPNERSYEDRNVARGVNYFYYIQAVGQVNNDATGLTPTGVRLKSNRYYTQTYLPANLKRGPGSQLSDVRIVPNPFNISSAQDIRWPGVREQLGFLNIPGNCTIKIFTERGDLVATIEHTDGTGDEFWDLSTAAKQLVVTGLYMAVIEDNTTGERIFKKFVVVR